MHPTTNPGDGREQCEVCGKYVFPVTHSCSGVRVAAMDGGPSFWPYGIEREAGLK